MERHGQRAEWTSVPTEVRSVVDMIAGAPIVRATNVAGGFSPGPAVRCDLADGKRVFVKACGERLSTHASAMHRREAAVMAAIPIAAPVPRLIGAYDDRDWVALVIELVDGRMPAAPLSSSDIAAILRVVEVLADIGTTTIGGVIEPAGRAQTKSGTPYLWRSVNGGDPALDDWSRRNLDRLTVMESSWIEAVAGSTLLHGDLRSDNILIGDDITYVVDWPGASVGAEWVDLVGLLPSLHHDGAPPPARLFDRHPLGRRADPSAVDAYLCAISGYFTFKSLLPPPPGLPTLRPFQAAQAAISREWLAEHTGWR